MNSHFPRIMTFILLAGVGIPGCSSSYTHSDTHQETAGLPTDNDEDYTLPYGNYTPEAPVPPRFIPTPTPRPHRDRNGYRIPEWYLPFNVPRDNDEDYQPPTGTHPAPPNGHLPPDNDTEYVYPLYFN